MSNIAPGTGHTAARPGLGRHAARPGRGAARAARPTARDTADLKIHTNGGRIYACVWF